MNENAWLHAVKQRIAAYWWPKMLCTTAAITTFMWAYFVILNNPLSPITIMPLTPIDNWIGFQPWTLGPYVSLWFYISLVPALLQRGEFLSYFRSVAVVGITGLVIFMMWPSAVPEPVIDWAQYPGVALLKSVDATGNACPSLHVAFSVLTALWLHHLFKRIKAPAAFSVINLVWCLLIVYSTLATKQHVVIDAASGAALGWGVAVWHLRAQTRSPRGKSVGRNATP